jgi:hypothetical protein
MWQPWDPTVGLQLKKIGNPIPLYARKFGEGKPIKLPELGKPVGFDLLKGDWVGPYGKGETVDFIFTLNATFGGMTKNGYQIHDSVFTVGFPKEGDGIQSVYAQPFAGSVLRLPRYAPEQGYQTNLFRQMYRHEDGGSAECREDQNYFFRVRTEKDEKGNIVRALYGKIHGEIGCWQNGVIRFSYYLNPTPNERNLEFDPSRNLFTDLKSTERMTDP